MPFVVLTSHICVLYGCAYVGTLDFQNYLPSGFNRSSISKFPFLWYGTQLLFWTGIALFFSWGLSYRKKMSVCLRRLNHPVLVVFFLVSVFLYFISYQAVYYWFDEGAHWGRVLKIMLHYDSFPGTDRYLGPYTHYPPGTTLFHYYVCSCLGETEGTAIFANCNLLLACILTGMFGHGRKRYFFIGLLLLVNYILLHQFSGGLSTLTADGALALLFGACLTIFFQPSGKNVSKTKQALSIVPGLFVLTLTKPIGIVLACVVVMLVLADYLATGFSTWQRKDCLDATDPSLQVRTRKKIAAVLALGLVVASPFLAYGSWDFRSKKLEISGGKLSHRHVVANLQAGTAAESLSVFQWPLVVFDSEKRARFIAGLTSQQAASLRLFALAFRTVPLSSCNDYSVFHVYHFSFCPAEMSCILLLGLPLLFACSPTVGKDRGRYCLMLLLLLSGYILYLGCLYVIFLTVFFQADMNILPSYPRYAGAYCHGAWMFYLALSGRLYLMEQNRNAQDGGKTRHCFFAWAAFFLIPIIFLVHAGFPYFIYYDFAGRFSPTRQESLSIAKKVGTLVDDSSTICLYERPGGTLHFFLPLDLFPADVHCRSLLDGTPLLDWVEENSLPDTADFRLLISASSSEQEERMTNDSYDLIWHDENFQLWKKNSYCSQGCW